MLEEREALAYLGAIDQEANANASEEVRSRVDAKLCGGAEES
jgi:hypothetical protein